MKSIAGSTKRIIVLLFQCVVLASLAGGAWGMDLDQMIDFNIPKQKLDSALVQFSEQARIQITSSSDQVKDFSTDGIVGRYKVSIALKTLLQRSGLSYKPIGQSAISIGKFPSAASVVPDAVGITTLAASQVTPDNPQNADVPASQSSASSSEKDHLSEIVVTGTHIAGANPISPVITIDRSMIDESGYGNVGEVIRNLPQDFGGGQNPGVIGANGSNNQLSPSSAASANLRGLGADSTLTLIDGHRFAYDGSLNGVDLSLIPLAAIDRVEVLTDGASAVYGSDAVAGVVNVILRKDFDGVSASARYGDTTQGGASQQQYNLLGGHDWGGGNLLVDYEHSKTEPLYSTERSFSSSALTPQSLYPELRSDSGFAAFHQDLSDSVNVFGDGLYTSRSSNFAVNPGYYSAYQETDVKQYGVFSGIDLLLSHDWTFSVEGSYSKDRDETNTSDNAETTNAVLATTSVYVQNSMWTTEAHAGGPLFRLPSGPVAIATGAGYRSEDYEDGSNNTAPIQASRNVRYAYGEAQIPIVEPSNERLGLERLDLNIASRFEHYDDVGSKTTSKVGLAYVPQNDIKLHATWSQSFRAPELNDRYGIQYAVLAPAAIYGGSAGADAIVLQDANRNLLPETATSKTVGLDFNPLWRPTLKISATYFDIDYTNRIVTPVTNLVNSIPNSIYAPFIVQNPTTAQQQSALSSASFLNFTGSPYTPYSVGYIINNLYQNATSQRIDGVDLLAQETWLIGTGHLTLAGNGSWLTIHQRLISTVPESTISGTIFNPPNFKARASATWRQGPWSLTATGNYVGSESDTSSIPYGSIASWTTADAQLAYTFSGATRSVLPRGIQVSLSIQNLFDRDPPHVAPTSTAYPGMGYDPTNASPFGRFISIFVSTKW